MYILISKIGAAIDVEKMFYILCILFYGIICNPPPYIHVKKSKLYCLLDYHSSSCCVYNVSKSAFVGFDIVLPHRKYVSIALFNCFNAIRYACLKNLHSVNR